MYSAIYLIVVFALQVPEFPAQLFSFDGNVEANTGTYFILSMQLISEIILCNDKDHKIGRYFIMFITVHCWLSIIQRYVPNFAILSIYNELDK